MKITPILFVDAIEPSLEFWVGRLNFEKIVEVPEGTKIGFVILQKGASEVMLQTRESIQKAYRKMPARPARRCFP
jgi:hypothetical protein